MQFSLIHLETYDVVSDVIGATIYHSGTKLFILKAEISPAASMKPCGIGH